eukprot:gnl/MRDRNA2_/MRDRNA2_36212_c0_seq1.p1 gnl/MRDRNA2_/MRDRNA2_36212_c0~~gnl/MRDRNA2_/MRDRNA2_36212_c0_seq1.p1  ORF type:complete len:276 (+),score=66.34 gnl/MRDRNA2_/MRDRNA2_36212_c0_seq1:147-974(+)
MPQPHTKRLRRLQKEINGQVDGGMSGDADLKASGTQIKTKPDKRKRLPKAESEHSIDRQEGGQTRRKRNLTDSSDLQGKKKKRKGKLFKSQPSSQERRTQKQESQYGPPVGVKTMANDEWQTCLSAWEALTPMFKSYMKRRVWQPFFYDGECSNHLRSLGFQDVIHTQEDFFVKVEDPAFLGKVDLIWDNPPYTSPEIKERILRALAKSAKPFCMLLPLAVLHAQFCRDVLDMTKVQAVIPRKVQVKKRNQDPVPFKYLVWLCYKMALPRDLYFI